MLLTLLMTPQWWDVSRGGDENTYLEEMERLTVWLANNLLLNTSKDVFINFGRKRGT